MAPCARITQAVFTINDIARLSDCRADQADRLYRLYIDRRNIVSRGIDVRAALGAMVFGAADKIGIPKEVVALHVVPLVNQGLFYLGSETMPWPVRGTPDQEQQFRQSMAEVDGFLKTRKVQELLNVQERAASRFLIWKGGDDVRLTDDLSQLLDDASEPALAILDVIAIANKLRTYRSGTLFEVEYV